MELCRVSFSIIKYQLIQGHQILQPRQRLFLSHFRQLSRGCVDLEIEDAEDDTQNAQR